MNNVELKMYKTVAYLYDRLYWESSDFEAYDEYWEDQDFELAEEAKTLLKELKGQKEKLAAAKKLGGLYIDYQKIEPLLIKGLGALANLEDRLKYVMDRDR